MKTKPSNLKLFPPADPDASPGPLGAILRRLADAPDPLVAEWGESLLRGDDADGGIPFLTRRAERAGETT
jgi:hypothetical protein